MTVIERFTKFLNYNPSKGLLKESIDDVDCTNWVCVGEVAHDPWMKGLDKVYVMVNPQKEMKWGKEINDVRYTENPDGTGNQTSIIPIAAKREIFIYPEHQDDEYGEMFLGKKMDNKTYEKEHNEFLSKLFVVGENVIIHHNSSYKITDGVIKKGKPNGWSNNTDVGIYFWGSRNSGSDPSGNSLYIYYCIIPKDRLYDFQTNVEKISLRTAMKKYGYAGQYWKDGESIVVTTLNETPISYILDKQTGIWYDKDWKEVKKPF